MEILIRGLDGTVREAHNLPAPRRSQLKLALGLDKHLDGILACCRHKVPFGVVEAINGNLRSLTRRGRGYGDHEYLILKAQRSTAQARLALAA
jgi:transposase